MARVFSGIQPTGEVHLGNYIGALRNWVAQQRDHDAFYCVVDLHALTVEHEAKDFGDRTLYTVAVLLAAGLDPDHCTLFVQSHVPEHTELTWLLNCVAGFGELRRMTQFKEKAAGQESVSVGLFDYPVLMAADILLYDTELVPVGEDQRQHLELARDLAVRFNRRFGETFVVPEPVIPEVGARIMDLQFPFNKMSKSADSPQGTILLVEPDDVTARKIKGAVTDSGTEVRFDPEAKPGISNLLTIMSVATGRPIPELEAEFASGGYARFKAAVADAVLEFLRPVRTRFEEIASDRGQLLQLVGQGAAKAQAIASATMQRARRAVGLLGES